MGRRPSAKAEAKRKKEIFKTLTKEKWKLEKNKPFGVSIREHIGHFLDRLSLDDGIKLVTIASIAVIIKPMVQKLPEFTDYLKNIAPHELLMKLQREIAHPYIQLKNPLTGEVIWQWGEGEPEPTEPAGKPIEVSEVGAWLMSFALASLIVYFGPSILQGLGGVRGLASVLLA